MKVLFLQNIKGVAQIGDIKEVSDGHARNYLIPRKLAKPADKSASAEAEALKKNRELVESKNRTIAGEIAKRLEGAVLEIKEGANSEGHLYGSIDAKKIVQELDNQLKIKINTDQIDLPHHLKTAGEHKIKIDLGYKIATTLTVRVLPS